jgi:tetratricopeptide (TPR) repeat protein
VFVLLLAAAPSATAQSQAISVEDHIALGVTAAETRDPVGAVGHFEAVLAVDSMNYEANWRLASAFIDIGKQTPDDVESKERDSLYVLAESHARRAIEAELLLPDGHYILAAAIGRASLTKGNKERVRRAREIRVEAIKALELDPEHDLAHAVLGLWHAEIKRLSGIQKWFAKNLYGGTFLDLASWDGAIEHMEAAVAYGPDVIHHRLALARIYVDVGRYSEARVQLAAVDRLPVWDVIDPRYKEEAVQLSAEIAGKADGT